jgi:hypothetical protein
MQQQQQPRQRLRSNALLVMIQNRPMHVSSAESPQRPALCCPTAPKLLFSSPRLMAPSGWNGKLGTAGSVAQITNAKYTDLALLTNADGSYILSSNFGQGAAVEVYDSTFQPAIAN